MSESREFLLGQQFAYENFLELLNKMRSDIEDNCVTESDRSNDAMLYLLSFALSARIELVIMKLES